MTTAAFHQTVKDWIATTKHPKTGRLYTEMVYQPMLELLAYLRANGFKTFIVSGRGLSSCGLGPNESTAFHPSRSWGAASRQRSECRTESPYSRGFPS